MNTEEKKVTPTEAPKADEKKVLSTEEHLNKISKGTIKLLQPIRAAGMDITELHWNFRNMTGWEYANAMDCDTSSSVFRITNRQALSLFAVSAAKETVIKNDRGEDIRPLDAQDIRERIGIDDSTKVIQVATVFFLASAREGNKRILS